MNPSMVVGLPLLLVAVLLGLPELRAFLEAIAKRRFYDDHMSRPRYRFYDPRLEDSDDDPGAQSGTEPDGRHR